MHYRIQFLDTAAAVISELIADARSAHGAIALVADLDWPPRAVAMTQPGAGFIPSSKATRGVNGVVKRTA
jgi:hypothetical protein